LTLALIKNDSNISYEWALGFREPFIHQKAFRNEESRRKAADEFKVNKSV